ncbi:hypothetical protein DI272_21965 [Streptomyces sp. Act143]|uniref:hypothetical protein n=1 Tax=Streptomyces sp. Act143 TaxID=2200760 RepID=UPI000D678E92|nr:hypothetical protein [Streptomyces sp. Act143]PWI16535.1 hypothetical protein DI272_21965 [Streptomyces sp. Act143]
MEYWRIPGRGGRLSDRLNRLVVIAAVLGIGAGGWGLWLETDEALDRADSREKITRACEGLVDPDKVLGLNGGTDRARPGSGTDDVMFDLDISTPLATMPTDCVIYRVGEPETSYEHFLLSVWATPSDAYAHIADGSDDPFDVWTRRGSDDVTQEADRSAAYPLGDGRLGTYGDNSVSVKAGCANEPEGKTSVNALAVARYAADGSPLSDADRRTLAELARTAAERLADRTGCTAELPALPAELPPTSRRLTAADTAEGTCAWYAALLRHRDRGRLPDRALGAPAGAHSSEESCLLAVSDDEAGAIWSGLSEKERGRKPYTPWWLKAESYFGDEAGEVVAEGLGDEQRSLDPGTTGVDTEAGVWWASSTCGGEPAVHTLTVRYPYEKYIRPHLRELFRAYVDDVAARRACTGLEFPTDFSS